MRARGKHKMEEWIPLFNIFLKSPSPETEASLWLDQASNSFLSSSSVPISRSSFVSLLKKPCNQNSSTPANKLLFIETLPNMVQSKILSFLLSEYQRFCVSDLDWLAREMLGSGGTKVVDFWVQRDAQNLLDRIPKPKFDWLSHLSLDSADDDSMREEFDSVPDWLSEKAASTGTILPWLPVSCADVDSEILVVDSWNGKEMTQITENMEEDQREVGDNIDHTINVALLQPDDYEIAAKIRAQITSVEFTSEILILCDEIRKFCLEKCRDSFRFLALIEPWNADDETAAVLLSNLHSGSEGEELGWPSQILCSIVLPKFLALQKSASRVLMSAMIKFCKIYQRAAEYALVFPLILRKEGINNFICEVISRVLKECLHLGHISGFFQKLLCGRTEERRCLFLPCHRDLISDQPIWNETLFILFQNILTHDVPLTQDSVDCLVSKVQELAERHSRSLKFGNFLLHFIAKCAPMLQPHKYQLMESVKRTNSLVTKSILSKLNAL